MTVVMRNRGLATPCVANTKCAASVLLRRGTRKQAQGMKRRLTNTVAAQAKQQVLFRSNHFHFHVLEDTDVLYILSFFLLFRLYFLFPSLSLRNERTKKWLWKKEVQRKRQKSLDLKLACSRYDTTNKHSLSLSLSLSSLPPPPPSLANDTFTRSSDPDRQVQGRH